MTMKVVLKKTVKKALAQYHYVLSQVSSKRLKEESNEELEAYFRSLGYHELPYPLPVNPLKETSKDLSFIIPVYNCEQYIGYCLDTILSQKTKYSYEVICVNDGSKDNSLKVLEEYQRKYPEIMVVVDQPNGGASKARNTGIDNAQGEYLAFVDSDDYVFDNYIEALMNRAKSANADIVQAGYHRVLANHTIYDSFPKHDLIFSIDEQEKVLEHVSGLLWSGVIRKSLFDNVRFPLGYWYEDMMTRNIIVRRAKVISIIKDCLYGYTYNPNSLSTLTWDSRKIKCLDQIFLCKKMDVCSDKVLGVELNSLGLSFDLQEFTAMLWTRMAKQPDAVKQKAFSYLHNYIKTINSDILPIGHELQFSYKIILDNDYLKWKHWVNYLVLCKG